MNLQSYRVPPTGAKLSQFEQGFKALSENGGQPGGQFGNDSDSVAGLRLTAIGDLNQALASLQAWQSVAVITEEASELLKALTRLAYRLQQQQQQDYQILRD